MYKNYCKCGCCILKCCLYGKGCYKGSAQTVQQRLVSADTGDTGGAFIIRHILQYCRKPLCYSRHKLLKGKQDL